jgi:hypothetical protein
MKSWHLWALALVITLASAVYQRLTGPTHPARGSVKLAGQEIRYRLIRTHGGEGDAAVRVAAPEPVGGSIAWKRFKTKDDWTYVPMRREGGELVAMLPHQPPAGKLAYRVVLQQGDERVHLRAEPVVIRFKGGVPLPVLVVHVIAMFVGMMVSTRAALEAFAVKPSYGALVAWTVGLLTVGGMILGPVVQKYAFGAYWTGWPFGTDLTDNKTAVAWLLWIAAWIAVRRGARPKPWVIAAAVVTLAVYLIPHSMFGSELKYE